jgi:flagellar protein FliS
MTNARTSYRQNDVRGASAVRLVVLLYEQLIQDLRQALQALEQNDIPLRTERINHAILVIGHLQSPLDFEKGGKVARDLDHFYNVLRQDLVQVQFKESKSGLAQAITDMLAVREAWIEVDQTENSPPAMTTTTSVTTTVTSTVTTTDTTPAGARYSAGNGSEPERPQMNWRG